eukprot:359718-Chlamydomonas_euryale.AAC.1
MLVTSCRHVHGGPCSPVFLMRRRSPRQDGKPLTRCNAGLARPFCAPLPHHYSPLHAYTALITPPSLPSTFLPAVAARHARTASQIPYEELDIQDQVGGGGFAIVYRATWKGTPVAVKKWFDPNATDQMMQEFRTPRGGCCFWRPLGPGMGLTGMGLTGMGLTGMGLTGMGLTGVSPAGIKLKGCNDGCCTLQNWGWSLKDQSLPRDPVICQPHSLLALVPFVQGTIRRAPCTLQYPST